MKRSRIMAAIMVVCVMLVTVLAGCGGNGTPTTTTKTSVTTTTTVASSTTVDPNRKYVIGVAQCHMNTPYRVALTAELEAAVAAKGYNWEFIFTDGKNDPTTQINNVYDLMAAKVDVILMAPAQSAPLTPIAGEVMAAGIPLVLVDRTIESEDYTAFVGGDNINAGEVIGQWILDNFATDEEVIVVEMQGTLGASATNDRHEGFHSIVDSHTNIKVVSDQSADYKRDAGLSLMENILQANDHIDVLYCHSDNMALGAIEAIEAAGRTGEMAVFGTDGQKLMADEIRSGRATGTVYYPTGASQAVDLIAAILYGKPYEKVNMLATPLILKNEVDSWYDKFF